MFLTPATDPLLGDLLFTLLLSVCFGIIISCGARFAKGALEIYAEVVIIAAGGKPPTEDSEPKSAKGPLIIRSLIWAGLAFAGIGASLLGYQPVAMGLIIFGGVGFPIPFLRLVTA
jgi:hypothetical protein